MVGFWKKKPKMKRRRSTIENLGKKHNEFEPEEQEELHRLGEYKRAEVEMPVLQQRFKVLEYPNFAPPKRKRNRSRRRTPTNRRKRNTSLKSLRGEEDKFHDYLGNSEDYSDLRLRDDDGNLIQPPSPPPTVGMLIDDLNKKKYIRGGKRRKRRRKTRRKKKGGKDPDQIQILKDAQNFLDEDESFLDDPDIAGEKAAAKKAAARRDARLKIKEALKRGHSTGELQKAIDDVLLSQSPLSEKGKDLERDSWKQWRKEQRKNLGLSGGTRKRRRKRRRKTKRKGRRKTKKRRKRRKRKTRKR